MSEAARQEAAQAGGLGDQVEGYLLWQATIAVAEERAQAFVEPMEWLTTSQRADVEQRYVADSLHHAQRDLERIAARCRSLRGEYERRYRELRLLCVGWAVAVSTCLASVTAATLSLIR
ncbi:cytochrome C oxidase subunit I [Streptomyces scabiei]|uniref:cytochrome C oxidase subunit I n=1 Tax=Streptomyces scabiei TaxID=1930 RepID=UPI0029BD51AD|nr:cytochrome C oxidase subunit I [Streptomyces scabiei]MDX3115931.1 cytochrome c oxidase subunit I [Streptomyces scabiei]